MTTTEEQATNRVLRHGLSNLSELLPDYHQGADLHHALYNEDYFVIGYAYAEEFLEQYGVFKALYKVQEYEKDNFGEVTTDLADPEKLANMLAYIIGEELLSYCPTLQDKWDSKLSAVALKRIGRELLAQEAK